MKTCIHVARFSRPLLSSTIKIFIAAFFRTRRTVISIKLHSTISELLTGSAPISRARYRLIARVIPFNDAATALGA